MFVPLAGGDDRIVLIHRSNAKEAFYLSTENTTDEGIIGNVDCESGDKHGRFLNSDEAILYDDYYIESNEAGKSLWLEINKIYFDKFGMKYEVVLWTILNVKKKNTKL